jgi:heme A synthase
VNPSKNDQAGSGGVIVVLLLALLVVIGIVIGQLMSSGSGAVSAPAAPSCTSSDWFDCHPCGWLRRPGFDRMQYKCDRGDGVVARQLQEQEQGAQP